MCARHHQQGRAACPGIGYRSERRVDEAILAAIAPLVGDGKIATRSLEILRKRIEERVSRDGRAAERQRVTRALADSEREESNLARAVASGARLEPLLVELEKTTKRTKGLRAELAKLDASPPPSLDARRILASIKKRLAELSNLRERGGIEARPVVAAVLGDTRFTVVPVEVNGERRWQLTARISRGFLVTNVVQSPSAPSSSSSAGWAPSPSASFWTTTGILPGGIGRRGARDMTALERLRDCFREITAALDELVEQDHGSTRRLPSVAGGTARPLAPASFVRARCAGSGSRVGRTSTPTLRRTARRRRRRG